MVRSVAADRGWSPRWEEGGEGENASDEDKVPQGGKSDEREGDVDFIAVISNLVILKCHVIHARGRSPLPRYLTRAIKFVARVKLCSHRVKPIQSEAEPGSPLCLHRRNVHHCISLGTTRRRRLDVCARFSSQVMKYGKEFQQILADPSFPEDWKSSAIEYRRVSPKALLA